MSEIGKNYLTETIEENTQVVEMTVYTALNKRKIYLDRLNKLRGVGNVFLGAAPANAKDINGMTLDEFTNKCKSNYDKAIAIIRNFYALNAAITKSNALTMVEIGGVQYTVAEAIVRYDRLNNEIEFLNSIAENVAKARATITKANTEKLSEKAVSDYVTKMLSSINISIDDADAETAAGFNLKKKFEEDYIAANTYALIDPYNHSNTIEERMESLKAFVSEFNEKINICNMQTVITVNLVSD